MANPFGALLGGRVMHLVDIVAATAAMRHCRSVVATAAVDQMVFQAPVHIGHIIILKASVNRAFKTSMEVGVRVSAENPMTGEVRHTSSAYLTFVATDQQGKPIPVPPILPQTDEEKRRYDDALRRRELRLLHRKSG
jgi:acyl-CoA hydrolase